MHVPHTPDTMVTEAISRLRTLSKPQLTERERQDQEWERGRIAGASGQRLHGYESTWWIAGHARGLLARRGGR